jgi:hypothetical protein
MKIQDIFSIENARSKGFEVHKKGPIPFVTNGFHNNGIVGFVEPLKGERVFNDRAICVSAFCEATVQYPPFLPRGNGGSGLIVLTPKEEMVEDELYFYAAQINKQSWRFSFGRMVIQERIAHLPIRKYGEISLRLSIKDILPKDKTRLPVAISKFKSIPLTDLCSIERKYAPYINQLNVSQQKTPYVTTTEKDNGISIWCNEEPNFPKDTLTVSLDGQCGTCFYQFDDFIAGEKTAVLRLKDKNDPSLLFYVGTIIEKKSWRYNYGIKLSMARLQEFLIPVPVTTTGELDSESIRKMVHNTYGSEIFEKHAAHG